MYEKVRIGDEESRVLRCDRFLDIFEKEGCRMMEMSCADHDKYAAESQFITHTVGRILEKLRLESTPINTKGYDKLLDLVDNTSSDSFDLYYGLFMYNKNAMEVLERLDLAFESLKTELFGHLHHVLRKQLFGKTEGAGSSEMKPTLSKLHPNGPAQSTLPTPSQPFDLESQISDRFEKSTKLKIAIIGFGNFGQFLAKTLVRQGHTVLAHSRSDYTAVASNLNVSFFRDADDLCEEHPEVILFCSLIISTERVLLSLPIQRLKRSTLFVDVLSVKEFPKNLSLQNLPNHFDILCIHPMFGPEIGKDSWNRLPFVYEKVRIGSEESRVLRCDRFLDIFAKEGCRMEEMSCTEHDKYAAGSQFKTHTVGRILEKLRLESTPINTKGYDKLLDLVDNTASDSFDLYYGLFMYNKNAMEELERLDLAFESLKTELFGHLHHVLRKQLFGKTKGDGSSEMKPTLSKLPPYEPAQSALPPSDTNQS